MASTIVIFASNVQAETPQMAVSDRAAIGLAISRFADPVAGFCPPGDELARNFGAAAKIAKLESLSMQQLPDFDVALVGQCALTEFGDELAGALAENRSATLAFDVLDVHQNGPTLTIIKDAGQGNREQWIVDGPVVMVISPEAVRPPYVSRYRRMMAARNRLEQDAMPPLTIGKPVAVWEGVRPRAKLGRRAESYGGQAEDRMSAAFGIAATNLASANDRLIVDDAATCARHLMRYLAHHGFLPASLSRGLPDRKETSTVPRSPKSMETSAGVRNVSVAQRTARGPKSSGDSPQRLARRPRFAQGADGSLPTSMLIPRAPRPSDRSPDSLARRPRKLND